jgi:4-hydroxy-tetrahydrodipicolinate synthase
MTPVPKRMKKISVPLFAILTPFQASGKIDFTALNDYLSFLQEKNVKTILTNGTTAEFPSLSLPERMALLEYCRKEFNGIILNNVSSCCLGDCFKLVNHSENYADALVVLPPYYYANVGKTGILSFLAEVLNQSRMPTYLYHFPKHTQNPITPQMVEKLLNDHKNLIGIKDSETNLEMSLKFKALKAGMFQVFVGGDRVVLEVLKSGLDGSVTGGGNAFPEFLISIARYFQAGDLEKAETMQSSLNVWNQFRKQNTLGEIAVTKIALRTRLKDFPILVRAPLQTIESTALQEIELFVQKEIISLLAESKL